MTKRFFLFLSILILFCSGCITTKSQFGQHILERPADTTLTKQQISKIRSIDNSIFDKATFVGKEQIEIKYRIFKPKHKSDEKYPLVVVYHGSGAIGTDNNSQLGLLHKLFASPDIQSKYPCYVLAPQFPMRSSDYKTDTERKVLYSTPRPCLNEVFQLIDSLKSNLNIDNKRIYVVGFSMGGSTVINSLSARPDLFAAGISVAGIPQFDQTQVLKNIPIWLIHGIDDTENTIHSDEVLYKEIGNNIRFWKLKATTHDNVFSSLILGETLPKWLFKYQKK
jgi:predicted peptidase